MNAPSNKYSWVKLIGQAQNRVYVSKDYTTGKRREAFFQRLLLRLLKHRQLQKGEFVYYVASGKSGNKVNGLKLMKMVVDETS